MMFSKLFSRWDHIKHLDLMGSILVFIKTIGTEVCRAVLSFLHNPTNIASINHTHLVLIPKSIQPRHVSKYRPISLCNVLYKIITKMITNRLKSILPLLISPTSVLLYLVDTLLTTLWLPMKPFILCILNYMGERALWL